MMLKKLVLLSSLLVTSMTAQAALISHFGYERDSASNVVIGGGLEWLRWDLTRGRSINQAVAEHAGWTLASNMQMASLFNVFQFGKTNWSTDESLGQAKARYWDAQEEGPHEEFMRLFGITAWYGLPHYTDNDPFVTARAVYGSDENGNLQYNVASVGSDFTRFDGSVGSAGAVLWPEGVSRDWRDDDTGVALVRARSVIPPDQVSLPGSLSLLALGLVALLFRRRQVLCR
jgi:hypothetical protein